MDLDSSGGILVSDEKMYKVKTIVTYIKKAATFFLACQDHNYVGCFTLKVT